MGTLHGLPVRPSLEGSCPAWCEDHVEDVMPIGERRVPYVVHIGPVPVDVPGFTARLEWQVNTDEDTGRTVSDGPQLWLVDEMNGGVAVPTGALEVLAGALIAAGETVAG